MGLCIITQQTTSGRLRLLSPLSHQAPAHRGGVRKAESFRLSDSHLHPFTNIA